MLLSCTVFSYVHQRNKQTNKQINKQTRKQANKQADKEANKRAKKQASKQTGKETNEQTNERTHQTKTNNQKKQNKEKNKTSTQTNTRIRRTHADIRSKCMPAGTVVCTSIRFRVLGFRAQMYNIQAALCWIYKHTRMHKQRKQEGDITERTTY